MRVISRTESYEDDMDSGSLNYERFLKGEKEGLVEIIREYKDGLIFYLNSVVKDVSVSEELAEETFVRLAVKRPKDKKTACFKTLLYTVGRNIAIDYYRKNKKKIEKERSIEEVGEVQSEVEDPLIQYIKNEEKMLLHRAVRQLKIEYRMVLWLIYFEGLSHKEVAEVMKRSVHAVETLVYRARLKLKEELEKEGYVYEGL